MLLQICVDVVFYDVSCFQGKTVFMPGLLASAHRGILYVDDINLLDTELCQILLGIVTDGWVNVEVRPESKRTSCRSSFVNTASFFVALASLERVLVLELIFSSK